jgi:hypothetical protein
MYTYYGGGFKHMAFMSAETERLCVLLHNEYSLMYIHMYVCVCVYVCMYVVVSWCGE